MTTPEETRKKLQDLHRIEEALALVKAELLSAMAKFPPMHSAHEGRGVLEEEMDELWDEIKRKQGERNLDDMKGEAVQVAAMAVRFILDICTPDKVQS